MRQNIYIVAGLLLYAMKDIKKEKLYIHVKIKLKMLQQNDVVSLIKELMYLHYHLAHLSNIFVHKYCCDLLPIPNAQRSVSLHYS